jgi:hypothetical protein
MFVWFCSFLLALWVAPLLSMPVALSDSVRIAMTQLLVPLLSFPLHSLVGCDLAGLPGNIQCSFGSRLASICHSSFSLLSSLSCWLAPTMPAVCPFGFRLAFLPSFHTHSLLFTLPPLFPHLHVTRILLPILYPTVHSSPRQHLFFYSFSFPIKTTLGYAACIEKCQHLLIWNLLTLAIQSLLVASIMSS